MENQELMRYLKDAITLETDTMQQERIIAEFDVLQHARRPILRQEAIPPAPEQAGAVIFIRGSKAPATAVACPKRDTPVSKKSVVVNPNSSAAPFPNASIALDTLQPQAASAPVCSFQFSP